VEREVRDDLLRDTIAAYRENAVKELTRQFTVRCESAECR
jgi:hypothetical protein